MVKKSQLWASVLLVSTFAAGAVAGGGALTLWNHRHPAGSGEAERGQANRGERGFVATLTREVNLTPAQRDSVKAVLRKYDPAFRSVMEGTRPKFDSLRALVHADIRSLLTADQQQAFARWVARMDSATAARRARDSERNRKDSDRNKKENSRAR